MHVVELLLDTAVADNRLLIANQEHGDHPERPRDIDFCLYAKDEDRAQLVASFISDNRYGKPSIQKVEHESRVSWRLVVTIHAPTTENVLHTLSAFMVCLSQLYSLDYDGWESAIQR